MNPNYRQLIRNLRLGTHNKLKIMQAPTETQAIAALFREDGAKVEIYSLRGGSQQPPGHPLPLTHWRIQIKIGQKYFSVYTSPHDKDNNLYIVRMDGPHNSQPAYSFVRNKIDLSDPHCITKALQIMKNYKEKGAYKGKK